MTGCLHRSSATRAPYRLEPPHSAQQHAHSPQPSPRVLPCILQASSTTWGSTAPAGMASPARCAAASFGSSAAASCAADAARCRRVRCMHAALLIPSCPLARLPACLPCHLAAVGPAQGADGQPWRGGRGRQLSHRRGCRQQQQRPERQRAAGQGQQRPRSAAAAAEGCSPGGGCWWQRHLCSGCRPSASPCRGA